MELHTLTLAARSYALLMAFTQSKFHHCHPSNELNAQVNLDIQSSYKSACLEFMVSGLGPTKQAVKQAYTI